VQGIEGFASYPDILNAPVALRMYTAAISIPAEVNMVTRQAAHSVFAVQRKIA
jgi:trk system potassium uptake protein TrkA